MTDKSTPSAPLKGAGAQTDDPASQGGKKVSSKPSTSTNKRDLRSPEQRENLQRRFDELVNAATPDKEVDKILTDEFGVKPQQLDKLWANKGLAGNSQPDTEITIKAKIFGNKHLKFFEATKNDEMRFDRTEEKGKFIAQIIKATESPLDASTGENSDP